MIVRLNLLLLLLLVLSALYLVHVRHESRQLFAANERAKREQRRLGDEHVSLQARLTQQTSAMAAERGADKLGMKVSVPEFTHFVPAPQARASEGGR